MEAPSRVAALSSLRARLLVVTSLQAAESVVGNVTGLFAAPVKQSALVLFVRSFATLISAGVSIRRSLEVVIQECADARLKEALCAVTADVENGFSLSAAIGRRPREFPVLFAAMLRAGELGGTLDETLHQLAVVVERRHALRKKVVAALTYPAVVAIGAVALLIFLLTSVIPMFAPLFAQLNVPLPLSTALLMRLSASLTTPKLWVTLAAGCALGVLLWMRVKDRPGVRGCIDRAALRLPIFGSIARKTILARVARMLGSLLRSGVDVTPALAVVSGAIGNAVYETSLKAVGVALASGEPLAVPLQQSRLYDPTFLQMVRVGEETGVLDRMLLRVADYYEVDVEAALSTLGSVLEPLLIAILGLVVGVVTASVYIPLYSLIGNMK